MFGKKCINYSPHDARSFTKITSTVPVYLQAEVKTIDAKDVTYSITI